MLSYRHSFHAGNFADVLKHSVLALLLEGLRRKEAPFCYLETHAGVGRYDLHGAAAQKTGEWREGIARLWPAAEPPEAAAPYLDAVRALNGDGNLRFYPGSPRIARHLLRPQDRMVLMELHPTDLSLLQQEFADDRQVAVHHRDGYTGLKAFLPPQEKRGVVLIDPSYEVKDEFDRVVEALIQNHRRWPTGIYALWYPILNRASIDRLHRRLRDSGIRRVLYAELSVKPDDTPPGMSDGGMSEKGRFARPQGAPEEDRAGMRGMNGSGMLLINPPWQLDQQLTNLLPWLWRQVDRERRGHYAMEWLVPE